MVPKFIGFSWIPFVFGVLVSWDQVAAPSLSSSRYGHWWWIFLGCQQKSRVSHKAWWYWPTSRVVQPGVASNQASWFSPSVEYVDIKVSENFNFEHAANAILRLLDHRDMCWHYVQPLDQGFDEPKVWVITSRGFLTGIESLTGENPTPMFKHVWW